jgi:hypothetical protein
MEVHEIAPCMDCGHDPQELRHFVEGRHTYSEYRVFDSLSLVLCNFCQVDFGSYDPTYFGLPESARIGFEHMDFVRDVVPSMLSFGKVCPECHHRLDFLEFVSAARKLHQSKIGPKGGIQT